MSTSTNDNHVFNCANCGKGEDESVSLKNCVACKMVKYCGRDCQKSHRSQHKKECRKRAAELHDEELFKQPPLPEDCPICFERSPTLHLRKTYMSCCGKIVCSGCIHANANMAGNADQLCPFCRTPAPTSEEEANERENKRIAVGDAQAIHNRACRYAEGMRGFPQDRGKALEFWHRAGELGYASSYFNIGLCYIHGLGVERDEKKAKHYWELGAIGGNANARHSLGIKEVRSGNMKRALKHFMIAVEGGGYNDSLNVFKQLYLDGHATKDDYAKALKAYQAYLSDIRNDQRDEAAEFSEDFKYYEL